jgi:hypothetical protein
VIWGHGNMLADDVEAHKCPKCGKQEWKHFSGGQAVRRPAQVQEKTSYKDLAIVVLATAVLAAAIVIALDLASEFLLPRKL